MILNLNTITFSPYGTVYTNPDYQEFKSRQGGGGRIESYTEASPVYYAAEDIWMDQSAHPTILTLASPVRKSGQQDAISFLLDKPIHLKKNRCFQITPLGDSCAVEFFPHNIELKLDPQSPLNVRTEYDSLEILDIHTIFYQEKELGFQFKGESHPTWELTYVDIGEMYSRVEGVDTLLKQGDLAFYGPNQHHSQYAESDKAVNYYTITFSMNLPQHDFLLNQSFQIPREIAPLLGNIMAESKTDKPYAMELMKSYLTQFMVGVLRYLDSPEEEERDTCLKSNVETGVVQNVCNFITENIFSQISVAEIAKHVNLSAPYLSVLFRRKKGIKIIDYITLVKLNKSKELIHSGGYSITQISEMLGYSSIHYFSRQFKQKYGITPTQYARGQNGHP